MLERSPVVFRRKLSEAGYVAAVEADDAALQIAMVVESTPERHRAARLLPPARRLRPRRRSVRRRRDRPPRRALLPGPATTPARCASTPGLRPLTPDHIPIIGPFHDAPNICVATGHEGAGIGLAPATGELVAAWHTGATPRRAAGLVLPGPLRPGRARRLVIEVIVDGAPLMAPAGQSLAAALLSVGPRRAARRRPRGLRAGCTAGSACARSAACWSTARSCARASPRWWRGCACRPATRSAAGCDQAVSRVSSGARGEPTGPDGFSVAIWRRWSTTGARQATVAMDSVDRWRRSGRGAKPRKIDAAGDVSRSLATPATVFGERLRAVRSAAHPAARARASAAAGRQGGTAGAACMPSRCS